MKRRRAAEALELIGQIKYRAVVLVAGQAFEGAPDFRMKLQTLESVALDRFGTSRQLEQPHDHESSEPLIDPAAADGAVPSVPVVTDGTSMNHIALSPPSDKLTIKALCGHFNISRRCLMRLFKEHEKCSPGAWVRSVRLEAARILRNDGCSFKEIANRLGYSSRSSVWRLVRNRRSSPVPQNRTALRPPFDVAQGREPVERPVAGPASPEEFSRDSRTAESGGSAVSEQTVT